MNHVVTLRLSHHASWKLHILLQTDNEEEKHLKYVVKYDMLPQNYVRVILTH